MTSLQYPSVYAVGSFGNTPVTMPTAAYQYDPDGRLSGMTMDNGSGPYSYSATQNNGRITGSADGMTGENTTYTYDASNRLTAASNSLWSASYGYDGFGNLTSKSGSGGSPNAAPNMSATYNANNQQNGVYYDANGNQGDEGGYVYGGNTYSVENRLVWEVEGGWPYPGKCLRVRSMGQTGDERIGSVSLLPGPDVQLQFLRDHGPETGNADL